jgi:glycosyltransferase involved in cell wall biosynthesis
MPRVTIAIPVYNKGKYLAETIESALDQTFEDLEILILDNCSTDDSWSVIDSFDDPRLRKVRWPENIGRAGNFNKSFELARGEFVKIFDADDVLMPNCVEAQVRAFDEFDSDVVMVVGRHDFISAKGRTLLRAKGVHGMSGYYSGREAAERSVRAAGNMFGTETTSLVRTSAARQITWRETDYEIDLYLRLFALGGLVVLPESVIKVRLNGDSHSSKHAKTYAAGYERAVNEFIGSGAFPDLQPLSQRERLRTSFYVLTYRMIQWVGIRI